MLKNIDPPLEYRSLPTVRHCRAAPSLPGRLINEKSRSSNANRAGESESRFTRARLAQAIIAIADRVRGCITGCISRESERDRERERERAGGGGGRRRTKGVMLTSPAICVPVRLSALLSPIERDWRNEIKPRGRPAR